MANRILVVKGSPRSNGNSSLLADRAAAGARRQGAQVDIFELHKMNLQPCDGCDGCSETGQCVIGDDMQLIYPKLLDADGFILASPIYWAGFSAQLKLFIDRWYAPYYTNNRLFAGKPFGILFAYADASLEESGGFLALRTLEYLLGFTGAVIAGCVHGSASDAGAIASKPEVLEQAFELGERVGAWQKA